MIRAIELAAVRLVAALVSLLPMRIVRRCGAILGRVAYSRGRCASTDCARESRVSVSVAARNRTARAGPRDVRHFGSLLLELLKFGTYTPDQMRAAVDVEGEERARQAYQQGRGVLFFTGHFGYWEIHGDRSSRCTDASDLGACPAARQRRLNEMLERIRTRTGNSVIYRQGAVRKVLRELAANHGVALLIDQHLHTPDAVYVDFFRRPAATTSALGGACAAHRCARGSGVRAAAAATDDIDSSTSIPSIRPTADTPDAVREFTQRCTDVLEMYVRRHPELWLWMHRRWRDQDVTAADDLLMRDEPDAEADV